MFIINAVNKRYNVLLICFREVMLTGLLSTSVLSEFICQILFGCDVYFYFCVMHFNWG